MTHNQLFTAQRYNIKNILIFLFFFKKTLFIIVRIKLKCQGIYNK